MNDFFMRLEEPLLKIMDKVSNQKHLSAVRDGLIATIPITVIGAVFLLIPTLPFPQVYVDFMSKNADLAGKLFIPFHMTLGLLSVYANFAIGSRLAKSYGYDGLSGGVIALLSFFVTLNFTNLSEGSFLSTAYLGGEGMFTAILTALFAVEVLHFCKKKNITIKLPEMVPPNVGSSFESLIPVAISVTIVWFIVHIVGFDINAVINSVITPILSISSNSILTPLIFVLLTGIMWFFGIHPAVLAAIMTPIWLVNSEANMLAAAAGQVIPNVGVQPFIFTFLWIGGGGGTLALSLLMSFSKSKQLKSLGRLSIGPGLFNINEPVLFGLPIVLNPILIIPFIVAPMIATFITYFAFTSGIVPGMGYPLAAVWNLPSVFAGFVSTASIMGALLVLVNFVVMGLVYYPFFRIYEKKVLATELNEK